MTQPATHATRARLSTPPVTRQSVSEEQIRIRAYELYQKRDGNAGDAEGDWYRAEAELASELAASPK